jgi:hypothetical protein
MPAIAALGAVIALPVAHVKTAILAPVLRPLAGPVLVPVIAAIVALHTSLVAALRLADTSLVTGLRLADTSLVTGLRLAHTSLVTALRLTHALPVLTRRLAGVATLIARTASVTILVPVALCKLDQDTLATCPRRLRGRGECRRCNGEAERRRRWNEQPLHAGLLPLGLLHPPARWMFQHEPGLNTLC